MSQLPDRHRDLSGIPHLTFLVYRETGETKRYQTLEMFDVHSRASVGICLCMIHDSVVF